MKRLHSLFKGYPVPIATPLLKIIFVPCVITLKIVRVLVQSVCPEMLMPRRGGAAERKVTGYGPQTYYNSAD